MNIIFLSVNQTLSDQAVEVCAAKNSVHTFRSASLDSDLTEALEWSDHIYALDEKSVDEVMNRTGILHIDKIHTVHVRNSRLLNTALSGIAAMRDKRRTASSTYPLLASLQ